MLLRRPVVVAGTVLLVVMGVVVTSVLLLGSTGVVPAHATGSCQADVGPLSGSDPTLAALTAEQRTDAAAVVQTGQKMSVPAYGLQIALATAYQESRLINVAHGDAAGPDSLGIFQQRASWGPASVRMDPAGAAGLFYTRLLAVPHWQSQSLWSDAQAVQHSAFPTAYQQWATLAAELLQSLSGVDLSCSSGSGPSSAQVEAAIAFAQQQLGKPYVWGATGPDSYDCSGLMLRAWQAAGVQLPRTSIEQWTAGQHVPLGQAQRGDLLFWSDDGTPGGIHHVAMYLGNGQIIEAQQTGVPLHIRPVGLTPPEAQLLPQVVRIGGVPTA
jgi:cell wall-associated NlpC family hydrolase